MRVVHWIALILVIVGALNWGMIGFFQINVVRAIFGPDNTVVPRIIYALVGLSGIWCFTLFKVLATCNIKKRN